MAHDDEKEFWDLAESDAKSYNEIKLLTTESYLSLLDHVITKRAKQPAQNGDRKQ